MIVVFSFMSISLLIALTLYVLLNGAVQLKGTLYKTRVVVIHRHIPIKSPVDDLQRTSFDAISSQL